MQNICNGKSLFLSKGTPQSDKTYEFGNFIDRGTHLLVIYQQEDPSWYPLHFGIIKSIPKDFCRIESCLELFSDRSPIIIIILQ